MLWTYYIWIYYNIYNIYININIITRYLKKKSTKHQTTTPQKQEERSLWCLYLTSRAITQLLGPEHFKKPDVFPTWKPQLGHDSSGSQSTEICCSNQTQQPPLSVPRGGILTQSTVFVMDTVTDRNKVSYIICLPAIQALQQSLTKFWQMSIQESSIVWAAASTSIAKLQLEMFRHIKCLEVFKYSFARIIVPQSPSL